MSEATRYTIFFVLSFVTFTAWGMIIAERFGTGPQAYCWQGFRRFGFGRSKKYPKRKRSRLAFSGSVR